MPRDAALRDRPVRRVHVRNHIVHDVRIVPRHGNTELGGWLAAMWFATTRGDITRALPGGPPAVIAIRKHHQHLGHPVRDQRIHHLRQTAALEPIGLVAPLAVEVDRHRVAFPRGRRRRVGRRQVDLQVLAHAEGRRPKRLPRHGPPRHGPVARGKDRDRDEHADEENVSDHGTIQTILLGGRDRATVLG